MFTQTWRQHWGLSEDPFACEDADKDHLLSEIDDAAVHSGFDRVFGNPRIPAPAIVFGEKGSGKSGLRRMMRRRLDAHNEAQPDARVFVTEYIDFDGYFEEFRRAVGASNDPEKAAQAVTKRWELSDHLDAILSKGVTELVEDCLPESGHEVSLGRVRGLSRKQKADFSLFTAMYYRSEHRTTGQALERLRGQMRYASMRPLMLTMLTLLLTAVGIFVALLPFLELWDIDYSRWWLYAGAGIVAATWLWRFISKKTIEGRARKTLRAIRVLPRDPAPLAYTLERLSPSERSEYGLPTSADPAQRYELVRRFLSLLENLGFGGWYVLMDRVDEPSILSGNADRMRKFVQKIFDIKLLQFPGLAMKLFLPIEMEAIYRSASAEELKRMRLDKSNLVPELKWTGEELYQIANQRLRVCIGDDSADLELIDLFEEGFDQQHLRDTLTSLGTPRYAFGFLSAVFLEYVRELPGNLDDDDERWRLPRSQFDVVRGMWIDRTGLMRRSLN